MEVNAPEDLFFRALLSPTELFSTSHALFFLSLSVIHRLYLFIDNSRPGTVSETGQYKTIPSIAHTQIYTHAVRVHAAHHTAETSHKNTSLV